MGEGAATARQPAASDPAAMTAKEASGIAERAFQGLKRREDGSPEDVEALLILARAALAAWLKTT